MREENVPVCSICADKEAVDGDGAIGCSQASLSLGALYWGRRNHMMSLAWKAILGPVTTESPSVHVLSLRVQDVSWDHSSHSLLTDSHVGLLLGAPQVWVGAAENTLWLFESLPPFLDLPPSGSSSGEKQLAFGESHWGCGGSCTLTLDGWGCWVRTKALVLAWACLPHLLESPWAFATLFLPSWMPSPSSRGLFFPGVLQMLPLLCSFLCSSHSQLLPSARWNWPQPHLWANALFTLLFCHWSFGLVVIIVTVCSSFHTEELSCRHMAGD